MPKKTIRDLLLTFAPTEPKRSPPADALVTEKQASEKQTLRDLRPPFADAESDPSQFEDFFSAKKTIKMLTPPFAELREPAPPPSNSIRTPDEKLFQPGARVGSYIIEGIIDPGGEVSRVYKARHNFANMPAAIKVLLTRHAGRKDLMAKMQAEAVALGRLKHPNVVAFYDADILDDLVWIAEEYLEGPTARDIIERGGGMALEDALEIVYQIGAALAAAHDEGILHLDVKPDNVIVSKTEVDSVSRVKLVDLGAAKFLSDSDSGSVRVVGTPEYMAPERFANTSSPDERADIYSLALVLYELVTGRHAIIRKGGMLDEQIEWLQCRLAPTMAPQFSFQLWEVVASALAKDPERRPRSAREFIAQLRNAAAQRENSPAASSAPTTVVTRDKGWSVLLGTNAGLVAGAALYLATGMPRAPRPPVAKPSAASTSGVVQVVASATVAHAPAALNSPPSPSTLAARSSTTSIASAAPTRPALPALVTPPISRAIQQAPSTPTAPRPVSPTPARPSPPRSAGVPLKTAPSAPAPRQRNFEVSNDLPF